MIKKILSTQLRINMVSGVARTVLNTIALAVAYPVYLHFLGYEKYGVWLVLATVLTFAQLGDLGLGQAVTKLVAEEYGRGDIKAIQKYITTALALLCLSGTIALIIILVLKTQIVAAFKLNNDEARLVLWLLPYIGVLSIYAIMVQSVNAILSGLGRMDLANWTQSVGQVAAVATVCFLLYSGRGIESLLIGSALSNILVHLISLVCIRRMVNIHILRVDNLDKQRCKRLLRFGGGVFGSSLISMFSNPFNKLMLSRYVGVSSIPIYEISYNGSMQVRALIEVGYRALMPEISRISADMTKYAKDKISQIYRDAMKLIFVFGAPMYVVLAIFAPILLRIWLGDKYVETLPVVFRIMLVGTFLMLVGVPAYYTIIGFGRVRDIIKGTIMSAGGNFILVTGYYVLTGHLSVYSVAWCFVLANIIPLAYFLYKTRHLMVSDTK